MLEDEESLKPIAPLEPVGLVRSPLVKSRHQLQDNEVEADIDLDLSSRLEIAELIECLIVHIEELSLKEETHGEEETRLDSVLAEEQALDVLNRGEIRLFLEELLDKLYERIREKNFQLLSEEDTHRVFFAEQQRMLDRLQSITPPPPIDYPPLIRDLLASVPPPLSPPTTRSRSMSSSIQSTHYQSTSLPISRRGSILSEISGSFPRHLSAIESTTSLLGSSSRAQLIEVVGQTAFSGLPISGSQASLLSQSAGSFGRVEVDETEEVEESQKLSQLKQEAHRILEEEEGDNDDKDDDNEVIKRRHALADTIDAMGVNEPVLCSELRWLYRVSPSAVKAACESVEDELIKSGKERLPLLVFSRVKTPSPFEQFCSSIPRKQHRWTVETQAAKPWESQLKICSSFKRNELSISKTSNLITKGNKRGKDRNSGVIVPSLSSIVWLGNTYQEATVRVLREEIVPRLYHEIVNELITEVVFAAWQKRDEATVATARTLAIALASGEERDQLTSRLLVSTQADQNTADLSLAALSGRIALLEGATLDLLLHRGLDSTNSEDYSTGKGVEEQTQDLLQKERRALLPLVTYTLPEIPDKSVLEKYVVQDRGKSFGERWLPWLFGRGGMSCLDNGDNVLSSAPVGGIVGENLAPIPMSHAKTVLAMPNWLKTSIISSTIPEQSSASSRVDDMAKAVSTFLDGWKVTEVSNSLIGHFPKNRGVTVTTLETFFRSELGYVIVAVGFTNGRLGLFQLSLPKSAGGAQNNESTEEANDEVIDRDATTPTQTRRKLAARGSAARVSALKGIGLKDNPDIGGHAELMCFSSDERDKSAIVSLECGISAPTLLMTAHKSGVFTVWRLTRVLVGFAETVGGHVHREKRGGLWSCLFPSIERVDFNLRPLTTFTSADCGLIALRQPSSLNSWYGASSPISAGPRNRVGFSAYANGINSTPNRSSHRHDLSRAVDSSTCVRVALRGSFHPIADTDECPRAIMLGCDDGEILRFNLDNYANFNAPLSKEWKPFVDRELLDPSTAPQGFLMKSAAAIPRDLTQTISSLVVESERGHLGGRGEEEKTAGLTTIAEKLATTMIAQGRPLVAREVLHWHRDKVLILSGLHPLSTTSASSNNRDPAPGVKIDSPSGENGRNFEKSKHTNVLESPHVFSLDESGGAALWQSSPDTFLGAGWFRPLRTAQFALPPRRFLATSDEGLTVDGWDGERHFPRTSARPIDTRLVSVPNSNLVNSLSSTQPSISKSSSRTPTYQQKTYLFHDGSAAFLATELSKVHARHNPIHHSWNCTRFPLVQETMSFVSSTVQDNGSLVILLYMTTELHEDSSKHKEIEVKPALALVAIDMRNLTLLGDEPLFLDLLHGELVYDVACSPRLREICGDSLVFVLTSHRILVISQRAQREVTLTQKVQSLLSEIVLTTHPQRLLLCPSGRFLFLLRSLAPSIHSTAAVTAASLAASSLNSGNRGGDRKQGDVLAVLYISHILDTASPIQLQSFLTSQDLLVPDWRQLPGSEYVSEMLGKHDQEKFLSLEDSAIVRNVLDDLLGAVERQDHEMERRHKLLSLWIDPPDLSQTFESPSPTIAANNLYETSPCGALPPTTSIYPFTVQDIYRLISEERHARSTSGIPPATPYEWKPPNFAAMELNENDSEQVMS